MMGGGWGGRYLPCPAAMDWSGPGWALLSHWGRATQNHRPARREEGKEEKSVERKGDEGGKVGSKQEKSERTTAGLVEPATTDINRK